MSRSATLLARLGIQLPLIQAPMAGVATPALAAAVSNAGALGSLGIGPSSVDQARAMIEQTAGRGAQRNEGGGCDAGKHHHGRV